MQKIGDSTALADENDEWTEGDPGSGTPATPITEEWLNTVQRELGNLVEGSGATLDPGNDSQVLGAVQAIAASSQTGLRNGFINGGFHIAQRGGVFANIEAGDGNVYTVDRWAYRSDGPGGPGIATVSRQGFAPDTTVPGHPQWYLRLVQSAAATVERPRLRQVIEDLQDWGGRQVTVSFYARTTVATQLEVGFVQKIGGGAADVDLSGLAASVSLDDNWQLFTVTVDLPDPTFAVQPGNGLAVEFRPLLNQVVTIELAHVQIEDGAGASVFERRPLELERLLCERYYQQSYDDGLAPGTPTFDSVLIASMSDANENGLRRDFAVQMRTTPTVRWFSPKTGTEGFISRFSDPLTSYDFAISSSASNATPKTTGNPTLELEAASDDQGYVHFTADAEL